MEDVILQSESAFSADSKGINKSTSQRILTMYQYSACFFNGHIGKMFEQLYNRVKNPRMFTELYHSTSRSLLVLKVLLNPSLNLY